MTIFTTEIQQMIREDIKEICKEVRAEESQQQDRPYVQQKELAEILGVGYAYIKKLEGVDLRGLRLMRMTKPSSTVLMMYTS